MSLKEENEKLFAKVLELQEEVARLRAEARKVEDFEDGMAELERRTKSAEAQMKHAQDRLRTTETLLLEHSRARDAIAKLVENRNGDGWDAWRRG